MEINEELRKLVKLHLAIFDKANEIMLAKFRKKHNFKIEINDNSNI